MKSAELPREFPRRILGGGIKVVGLLFVPLWLLLTGCHRPNDKVEAGPFAALGNVMAAQASHLCEEKGNLVLLVGQAEAKDLNSAGGQALQAFRQALPKSVTVLATDAVDVSPVLLSGTDPLPAGKFVELLQKHAAADVLVSFVGVPPLSPAQIAQLPSPRPKVVEVIVFSPPTKAMFANKLVYLAALTKPGAESPPAGSQTVQEIFDSKYQLITPETAGATLDR